MRTTMTRAEYAAQFTQVDLDLLRVDDVMLNWFFERFALMSTTKDERVHRQRLAEPRFAADLVPFPAGSDHDYLEEAA
ncbi:hypothetical protein ACFQ68_13465 [Amycolatopsis japonica]|uniref:hypothetical protein n=1 Tax=Amycolatopsis japonica TaxID=208439 RepID=UPI00366E2743